MTADTALLPEQDTVPIVPPAVPPAAPAPDADPPAVPADAAPAAVPADALPAAVPPAAAAPLDVLHVEAVATGGQIARWLGQVAGHCGGDPLSITITAATRKVHVHLPDVTTYRAWQEELPMVTSRTGHDELLGHWLEAEAPAYGWMLHLRLTGYAAEGAAA